MIPSLLIECNFDENLWVSSTMYIEIPKKTFENDMYCVFRLKNEEAYAYFKKMYEESKIKTSLKNDPHYKALRGLVRNVWFPAFQVTFKNPPDDKVEILHFFSNDYFYIVSLPTRMLASTVYELYQELLSKEKLEESKIHFRLELQAEQEQLRKDTEKLFGRMSVLDAKLDTILQE